MTSDHYEPVAAIYDFAYWDFTDDIDFYENLARIGDGPVLELGAGTGRVAVRLAEAGLIVTGLDSSPSMLARASANAKAARLPEKRLRFVQASMTDFDLDQKFSMVLIAANTFQHLLTTAEQRACLSCVAKHLQSGGVFAMAIMSPAAVSWEDTGGATPLLHHWTRRDPETGEMVSKLVAAEPDPELMVRHLTYMYDRVGAGGVMRRTLFETQLRFSTAGEVELLLQEAGLRVTHLYGDYDLTPVGPSTEHLIFVARAGGLP